MPTDRPERPRDHRPDTAQGEDSVDEEPCGKVGPALLDLGRDHGERRTELVEPCAGHATDRDNGRAGNELAELLHRQRQRLLVDDIGLRDGDDALLDAEQPEDREVLVRLRARALGSIDHQQEEVDSRGARDHRPDEPLVARDVDERKRRSVRKREGRVAEVDRDAAGALLREPIGVLARERADEGGLPVVDVTRGADGQRHALRPSSPEHRSGGLVDLRLRERPGVEQQPPVTDDAEHGRVAKPERRREPFLDRACGAWQLRERKRAPPTCATVSSTSPPTSPARRSAARERARAARRACGARESPPGALRVLVQRERPLEGGQRQLVRTERALQWVAPQSLDQLCATDADPGLPPAEQLVPGEADEIGAGGDARRRGPCSTSASEPEPRSSTSQRPASWATRARSSVVGLCVKAERSGKSD